MSPPAADLDGPAATEGRPLWHDPANRECTLASLTSLTYLGDELLSIAYSEPAASLLDRAAARGGRMRARPTARCGRGGAAAAPPCGRRLLTRTRNSVAAQAKAGDQKGYVVR